MISPIRIWDLPTRFFHWLLVTHFTLAWLTAGDSRYLDFHVFFGYGFLGLLLFRLLWGVIGSHYARFSSFCYSYSAVIKFLTNPSSFSNLGHTPAGSWAIWALLFLGFLVSGSGLLTLGALNQLGPLEGYFNFAKGDLFHWVHTSTAWSLLGLVILHLSGVILASRIHRESLIWAMITGFKNTTCLNEQSVPQHPLIAYSLLLFILISAGGYFQGRLFQNPNYQPFPSPPLPQLSLWQSECEDCHLAYHPTLLPQRSWQQIFAEQHNHFEEDLSLDEDTLQQLKQFAFQYPAESNLTKTAWKTHSTLSSSQIPLRITQTPYWREQHQTIAWKQDSNFPAKLDCVACHQDAESGRFTAAAMRLPTATDFPPSH